MAAPRPSRHVSVRYPWGVCGKRERVGATRWNKRTRSSSAPGTTAWSPPTCSPTPAGTSWCWRPPPHPGGAVRSGYVTAPGYLSDLFSSFYPLGFASPVLSRLDLHATGCAGRTPRTCSPTCCRTVGPRRSTATWTDHMASMEQFAPGDGERWRHAYDDWRGVSGAHARRAVHPVPAGARRARRWPAQLRRRRRAAAGPPAGAAGPRARRASCSAARAPRCCWPAARCTPTCRPEEAGGGVYGWLLAMLGPAGRLAGAGRRRPADHRRRWSPGCEARGGRIALRRRRWRAC